MRDFFQIEIELGGFQQLKTLSVRLEHAVLDAVVNHFDEVAGAARPDVEKAVLGRKSFKNGFESSDDFLFAADHHAVADLEPPDAAAGAGVDEVQAVALEAAGGPDRIFVIRVAAVDEDIVLG